MKGIEGHRETSLAELSMFTQVPPCQELSIPSICSLCYMCVLASAVAITVFLVVSLLPVVHELFRSGKP